MEGVNLLGESDYLFCAGQLRVEVMQYFGDGLSSTASYTVLDSSTSSVESE